MGKAKRATRKELEKVIPEIIQEVSTLRTELINISNYFGLYLEWKGDRFEFPEWIKERIDKAQTKTDTTDTKSDIKSEKKRRYRKITQPL
tara:strand:+ start:1655 stop:1924 length:270 start_codon:yes stop_codon:yes gene_type:complete